MHEAFPRGGPRAFLLACVFAWLTFGCGGTGPYVWYTALPRSEWGSESPEYVINAGDSINIKVFEQEGLSGSAKVRSDGRIALPLVGEIMVAGKHPSVFAQELENQLKRFIVSPRITVNVESSAPVSVTMFGELKGGGTITLDSPPRLLEAMAKAGGLSEFADDTKVFVLRPYPTYHRIRFTYQAIINNENGAAGFLLRSGDVILVE